MTKQHEIDGVTFFGELAETASSINSEDWAYFNLVDSLSDQIAEYMEDTGVSKAELARRLGSSRAFVTKVLAGDANMTLKTFSKVLFHLGAKPEVKIIDQHVKVTWLEVTLPSNSFPTQALKSWYAKQSKPFMRRESNVSCSEIAPAA